MAMRRAAIDADIFFFSISHKSESLTKRDINPYDIKKFLFHLSSHPDISLCVPISVLGEVVIICVEGEWKGREDKHNREELHELIDIWSGLRISFLHPNEAVATTCYNLYNHSKYKDSRIKPADLVHLGYALAYDVDFFITTDRILRGYSIPKEFKTKVLHPHEAQAILK
ncbi:MULTISPECIES: PIN domain-containing protein [Methanothrix]|jgi:hypothetical protein|nr:MULTISPECIES: PIN domain-containing protein [Methanothrix]UEC39555.1 MAG: hypothetical protein METHSR3v1_420002 [Methanothrix sp.]